MLNKSVWANFGKNRKIMGKMSRVFIPQNLLLDILRDCTFKMAAYRVMLDWLQCHNTVQVPPVVQGDWSLRLRSHRSILYGIRCSFLQGTRIVEIEHKDFNRPGHTRVHYSKFRIPAFRIVYWESCMFDFSAAYTALFGCCSSNIYIFFICMTLTGS